MRSNVKSSATRSTDVSDFVQRCQMVAGLWSDTSDEITRLVAVTDLLARFPIKAPAVERRIAASVFSRFATRLILEVGAPRSDVRSNASQLLTIQHWRVRLVLSELLAKHADRQLRLTSISREFGVSASYASRLVGQETGFGFENHLNAIRISKALALLQNPRLILKEVAAEAGFRDTAELDRQFKRNFAITPSTFRLTCVHQTRRPLTQIA